jgi:hypothetical protein
MLIKPACCREKCERRALDRKKFRGYPKAILCLTSNNHNTEISPAKQYLAMEGKEQAILSSDSFTLQVLSNVTMYRVRF